MSQDQDFRNQGEAFAHNFWEAKLVEEPIQIEADDPSQ